MSCFLGESDSVVIRFLQRPRDGENKSVWRDFFGFVSVHCIDIAKPVDGEVLTEARCDCADDSLSVEFSNRTVSGIQNIKVARSVSCQIDRDAETRCLYRTVFVKSGGIVDVQTKQRDRKS